MIPFSTSAPAGGIDVLLSARRVGPTGKAYGLDMTEEMLALARENQRRAGVDNVEFLKGEIESIPLPDNSVDVIISNCVINLSSDKPKALSRGIPRAEARRAVCRVRRGGSGGASRRRFAARWSCGSAVLPGRSASSNIRTCSDEAGFEETGIEPTRIYELEDAKAFLAGSGLDTEVLASRGERLRHGRVRSCPETQVVGSTQRWGRAEIVTVSSFGAHGQRDLPEVLALLAEAELPSAGSRGHISRLLCRGTGRQTDRSGGAGDLWAFRAAPLGSGARTSGEAAE